MQAPFKLDPEAFYSEEQLDRMLGIPAAIDRARKAGELRHTRKGHGVFFLGQWVRDWLLDTATDAPRQEVSACA
jgi:hypothetical protein